jgi:transposase
MKRYRPWDPNQTVLFPPSLSDWLPEDHLAYFMLDLVASLDLSAIEDVIQSKDARGTRPYDPQMMVALLLYGYCVGVRSSRRIERATHEDIGFRLICGEIHLDHSAINVFRKQHSSALSGLFVQVLQLCQEADMVKLGHVALDGTKMQANASKHKSVSYERLPKSESQLIQEAEALIQQALDTDAEEDELYGKDKRGDELPEEMQRREGRLQKLTEARLALEAKAAKRHAEELKTKAKKAKEKAAKAKKASKDAAKDSAEDARLEAGAAAAIALKCAEERVKVAIAEAKAKDDHAITPAEKKSATHSRQRAERALADLIKTQECLAPEAVPAEGHSLPEHRSPIDADGNPGPSAQYNFTDPDSRIMKTAGGFIQGYNCQAAVDEEHQVIVGAGLSNQSPDAEYLKPLLDQVIENCGGPPGKFTADAGYYSDENAEFCEEKGCAAYISTGRESVRRKADANPPAGKKESRSKRRADMLAKLQTEDGRAIYAQRKAVAEAPFGQIKEARGIRRFLLRGMDLAAREWDLICTTHNILKLFKATGKSATVFV